MIEESRIILFEFIFTIILDIVSKIKKFQICFYKKLDHKTISGVGLNRPLKIQPKSF